MHDDKQRPQVGVAQLSHHRGNVHNIKFEQNLLKFQTIHRGTDNKLDGKFMTTKIQRGFEINNGKSMMQDIYQATRDCAWIAGGVVRWMCSPRQNPITSEDIDIFMRTTVRNFSLFWTILFLALTFDTHFYF